MRPLFEWLTANRLAVTLGVASLILLGVVSAGSPPADGQWIQIPNLGYLFAVVVGVLALVGLILVILGKGEQKAERTAGEQRTVRSLLILVAIVTIGVVFFGPDENSEEQPTAVEETATATDEDPVDQAPNDPSNLTGTDIAGLILVSLIIGVGLVHLLRRSVEEAETGAEVRDLRRQLAPAVSQAKRQLEEETDPRSGVLLAYASLENALTELGDPRMPSETPREHMARVLVDQPYLEAPGVRLGELYQRARFSNAEITETDRAEAAEMLTTARDSLPTMEPHGG